VVLAQQPLACLCRKLRHTQLEIAPRDVYEAERQVAQHDPQTATNLDDGAKRQEHHQAQQPEASPREPVTWGEQPQSNGSPCSGR
jgi:hypothetical protein